MNPDTYAEIARLAIELGAGLVAGAAVGGLFFGGLSLTTRRLATASRPGLLVIASLVARTAVTVGAAIAVALRLGAEALLAFALGFTLTRIVLVGRAKREVGEERA